MNETTLTIAHWVANISTPVTSIDDWCNMVEKLVMRVAADGADIFLAPESINEQWCHFAPASLAANEELSWMAGLADAALDRLQGVARNQDIAIVTGSFPFRHENGAITNRAWMLFPDREPVFHDKLVLTPGEKDPDDWMFTTGADIHIFTWRDVKMTMLICLDIEMPHVSHRLSDQDLDLILLPSMTGKPSGFNRVFDCAKARAIELVATVAVTGMLGAAQKNRVDRDSYTGGAAIYIPCEEQFAQTGIYSELPMAREGEQPGKVLLSRDIPIGRIRACRHGQPEAWPGSFDASHVRITTL